MLMAGGSLHTQVASLGNKQQARCSSLPPAIVKNGCGWTDPHGTNWPVGSTVSRSPPAKHPPSMPALAPGQLSCSLIELTGRPRSQRLQLVHRLLRAAPKHGDTGLQVGLVEACVCKGIGCSCSKGSKECGKCLVLASQRMQGSRGGPWKPVGAEGVGARPWCAERALIWRSANVTPVCPLAATQTPP